jgi:hypothetical protein
MIKVIKKKGKIQEEKSRGKRKSGMRKRREITQRTFESIMFEDKVGFGKVHSWKSGEAVKISTPFEDSNSMTVNYCFLM